MFSVCLCTWNDLEYLKLLYSSFKKYTRLPCEFIVHNNDSSDGTLGWLRENNIHYTSTAVNFGVGAVNFAVENAKYDYIVDVNADMFFLPGWDIALFKQIKKFEAQKIDKFIISSRLSSAISKSISGGDGLHGVKNLSKGRSYLSGFIFIIPTAYATREPAVEPLVLVTIPPS